MLISLCLVQSLYIKLHQQEILPMGGNVLEFFYVPLYIYYFSDIHKKSQEASIHDMKVECQI